MMTIWQILGVKESESIFFTKQSIVVSCFDPLDAVCGWAELRWRNFKNVSPTPGKHALGSWRHWDKTQTEEKNHLKLGSRGTGLHNRSRIISSSRLWVLYSDQTSISPQRQTLLSALHLEHNINVGFLDDIWRNFMNCSWITIAWS